MPRSRRERVAAMVVLVAAVSVGVAAALGAVPGPSLLCITPYGSATSGPGCDLQHVSSTLAVVAGAFAAGVTAVLGLGLAAAALHIGSRCRRHRRSS